MSKDVYKILIMELWGLGDVVMMSAVLKPLRLAFPKAKIVVLCQEHGQQILQENKEISSFVTFKFPWTLFKAKYHLWQWDWPGLLGGIQELRRERFDLVLDGRGDLRNDFLAWLIAPSQYVSASKKRLEHRVDCWKGVLEQIGVSREAICPEIGISGAEQSEARQFIEQQFPSRPGQLIGIYPGASQPFKRWPLERFKGLAQRFLEDGQTGVIVVADPDGFGQELGQDLKVPVFKGNIRQVIGLLGQLNRLVSNDTGLMHMAAALHVPVTAVFGPGDPDIFGPRGLSDIVIKPCPGRPCFVGCKKKSVDCLLDISVEDVWQSVRGQMSLKTISLLGAPVSRVTVRLAVQQIGTWVKQKERHYVCVAPVSTLVEAKRNPKYKEVLEGAGMVTPDGMPVVWLAKSKGCQDIERTYGPDLMRCVCQHGQERGLKHFFYGGTEDSLRQLEQRLLVAYPRLIISGRYAPPMRQGLWQEDKAVIDTINASGADIIWVGLGSPKQDFWMQAHRPLLQAPVIIGAGAAFDFCSGLKPQAPRWMQRSGLEWFFRFCCEPKRLWKRYLIGNSLFIMYVVKDMFKKAST
ncbi:MAG: WecB/TagA/CpsF family glycosyltransferase [Candidatus Omnitrophica bacterium]|nr:WecB/TagA/CpsF family glycosyltransferase [Candidatus Omnitrophota bacterium]